MFYRELTALTVSLEADVLASGRAIAIPTPKQEGKLIDWLSNKIEICCDIRLTNEHRSHKLVVACTQKALKENRQCVPWLLIYSRWLDMAVPYNCHTQALHFSIQVTSDDILE
jgi:hypothetical protein